MNDLENNLNDLVPYDELNWIEEEGKFCLLSKEDIDIIIKSCMISGIEDLDGIEKIIRFAENKRLGKLLVDGVLKRRLDVNLNNGQIGFTIRDNHDD